jgi:hypothetical protein
MVCGGVGDTAMVCCPFHLGPLLFMRTDLALLPTPTARAGDYRCWPVAPKLPSSRDSAPYRAHRPHRKDIPKAIAASHHIASHLAGMSSQSQTKVRVLVLAVGGATCSGEYCRSWCRAGLSSSSSDVAVDRSRRKDTARQTHPQRPPELHDLASG